MARPRIGVTVSSRSGWRIFPLIAINVWLAGGRAVKWVGQSDVDPASVDGVIVGGGNDISPTLYGGELVAEARLDPDRDRLEAGIIEDALRRDVPLLGICRGSQMLNVVLGGNLHQDAYNVFESPTYRTILPRKDVVLAPGTILNRIFRKDRLKVNALHTQAVDRLGEGLQIAARDTGGMIQAIERTAKPFALGVQWHPEHLFYSAEQLSLFRALLASAMGTTVDDLSPSCTAVGRG